MRRSFRLAAVACALGLVVAACSEDSDGGDAADTTAAPAEETTVAPETTEAPAERRRRRARRAGGDNAERDQVGLDYVGAAEASRGVGRTGRHRLREPGGRHARLPGEHRRPRGRGRLHQLHARRRRRVARSRSRSASSRRRRTARSAARRCWPTTSVQYVLTGTLVLGNQPLYDTLAGQKPVFIGNPVTTPDFLAKDAFAFTPGSPGRDPGHGHLSPATMLPGGKPAKAAVVYSRQRRRAGRVQPADQARSSRRNGVAGHGVCRSPTPPARRTSRRPSRPPGRRRRRRSSRWSRSRAASAPTTP